MAKRLAAVVLLLALLCAACVPELSAPVPEPDPDAGAEALLNAQLGALAGYITDTEWSRALSYMELLYPLRQERLEAGRYELSAEEDRLVRQLNRLYERYTTKYLDDDGLWGPYEAPPDSLLAQYRIEDGALRPDPNFTPRPGGAYGEEDFQALWDQMTAMLPEGAYDDFTWFTVFSDGTDNTLAYVAQADSKGDKWEIAVDPADAEDGAWFTETVLHEYCHYLTLNDEEAVYTDELSAETYSESGLVTRPGSYLDDFYQTFWTDYLDDRRASPDSYGFFLRHEEDFITDYAAVDPSEDIAESFTYFVLWDPLEVEAATMWEQKLNFFYNYPELIDFRAQVRERLGLD